MPVKLGLLCWAERLWPVDLQLCTTHAVADANDGPRHVGTEVVDHIE